MGQTTDRVGAGSALTWSPCTVALGELQPWERNPKRLSKTQAARLLASWEELGQFQTLAIGPAGEVYDGHQRLSALLKLHGPRYTVQALRSDRALTEREREQIAVLSVTAVGSFDWDALAGWDASELTAWGLDADTLATWNDDAANLRELLATEQTDEDIDDIAAASSDLPGLQALKQYPYFGGDNPWDIPDLLPEMLLEIPQPLDIWAGPDSCTDDGRTWWLYNWHTDSVRGLPPTRTLLAFYTDDRRFEMLWEEPDKYTAKLLNFGITASIAPNFSLWADGARAGHLYNVFRSRYTARYLQEAGIAIIPDVNWADERSFNFCLLGIPENPPAIAVQLQTIKTTAERGRAVAGLQLAITKLQPGSLLVYGHRLAHEIVMEAGVTVPVVYVANRTTKRRLVIEARKQQEVL